MNRKLRHWIGISILVVVFLLLASKLVHMQTTEHQKLKSEGDNRSYRAMVIPAYRGEILDRNGKPLAISTPVDSVWVDPRYVRADDPQFMEVLDILNLNDDQKANIMDRVRAREGRSGFIYLRRQVAPFVTDEIKALNIRGVNFQREFKRFYPTAEVTSHVVGFTNVDGNGQEGIELQFNDILKGVDGRRSFHRDLKGGVAQKNTDDIPVQNGQDVTLSIDSKIQYIAYKYLKEGVIKNNAEAGTVVVENVHTGEILAMANYPSYNPNNMADAFPDRRRNRAVTDVYEPGSVIKSIAAAMALKSGQYDMDTIVNTSPGWYRVDTGTVRDFRNYGELDLRHILMKSSNVGISKVTLSMENPNQLSDTLSEFGFGSRTGIEFPGERTGLVPHPRVWGRFPLATLSFGYGMNVTALQLAQAYSALGNGGILIKPTLIKRQDGQYVEKHRVLSEQQSREMIDMLNSVVEASGGTGSLAKLDEYHVAGKTGTVRKAVAGGYSSDEYMTTFVGIAPSSHPEIAVVVTIDNPRGDSYGGGSVSAPIFSKIASHSLRILGVPPDKLN